MNQTEQQWIRRARLFAAALVCIGLAGGLSSKIFSNYYKEVYAVTSSQLGFIEIPRESPGVLCTFLVAALGWMGNVRMGILAQVLSAIGLGVLGLCAPSYSVMLVFLFIHSLGDHLFMPLNDSIAMDLAQEGKVGATLGRFKSISTIASMAAACLIFVGFRVGFFDLKSRVILPFTISAAMALAAGVLLFILSRSMPKAQTRVKGNKLVFRKAYLPYYIVTLAYGCQKRIRIVFAPWVIIELLHQGADVVAMLTIVVYFVGSVVSPRMGKLMDRLGVRKMLWLESGYIAAAFCFMGILAGQLSAGTFGAGWQSWVVYAGYVLCVLMDQFNMVHAFMIRSIADDPAEVTQTLSTGLSIDHVMAIIASPIMGLIWDGMGAQFVFYLAAASVALQLIASRMVKPGAVPAK